MILKLFYNTYNNIYIYRNIFKWNFKKIAIKLAIVIDIMEHISHTSKQPIVAWQEYCFSWNNNCSTI